MTFYCYSPLNQGLNEIRVLTLEPGEFSADLQISIRKVALLSENPPTYEALSYVWGTSDNQVNISVGPSDNDKLAVTQNLSIALAHLRYKTETRTLWIDAICINQQDLHERSSQVKRMGDIYSLADRVIVWLGTSKDNSTHILKTLSNLSLEIKVDPALLKLEPASKESDPQWSDITKMLPYSTQELYDIDALLRRPWFSRLWVWQEVRLAKTNALVVCGSDSISWQSFRQAILCIMIKQLQTDDQILDSSGLQDRLVRIVNASDTRYKDLGNELQRAAFCKCSDPKDRVYAILSLLDKTNLGINFEPDYTKTTAQVYQDVLFEYIERWGVLDLLRYCELRGDRSAEMPTWVPNWDNPSAAEPMYVVGHACANSIARVTHKGGGILSVTGVLSDTVSNAMEILLYDNDDMTIINTILNEIRRLAPPNIENTMYLPGGSLLDALVSTLCAAGFGDMTLPPNARLPHFAKSRELVLAVLQNKDLIPTISYGSDEMNYLEAVQLNSKARSFITTNEGYMGLAPTAVKPGDHVCVLLGCSKPLLLRPTSDLQYKVVGECYLHGLKDGEAFLGPIPDHLQGILVWDQGFRDAFMDTQTGKVQYNDPRVKEEDWKLGEGDTFRLRDDSLSLRVTPNMLKRRGIKLHDFDLI